jgi:phosphatidyl-myo-inositol dimannoside synthase
MSPQLLLSYDFPPMGGGIARWMGELARRFPAESLVISTGHCRGGALVDGGLPNRVDRLDAPSERLRSLQGQLLWCRRAGALARSCKVEFVWCGNIKPAGYPAWWIRTRVGVPYGLLVHGGDLLILQRQVSSSSRKRWMARTLLGGASVIVANSGWTRDLCRSVLDQLGIPVREETVRTVPLGSDPVLFRPGLDHAEVSSRYQLGGRRWLITVARLTRHKGIDTGIRLLAALGRRHSDLGYMLVGSGEDRAALELLAGEMGVADRVQFLGDVPDADLPALYNSAEIYLGLSRRMPDRVEGFGIALVEASACGLPVIAGRTGGIPDAVREGETGLLVDPESLDEICSAVGGLLDDRDRADRMGRAGRRAVEAYYNWNRVAADLRRIGRELGDPVNREVLPT